MRSLCEPRFSVVDYVKQKVPVQQDRPQHSIVREKEGEKEGEREIERDGEGAMHCICSRGELVSIFACSDADKHGEKALTHD